MTRRAIQAIFGLLVLALAAGSGAAQAETVKIKNGTTLNYKAAGGGDRTIVLIHGYSFSHRVWDKVIPLISKGWQVYAYDMRGFGDSDKPDSGYTYDFMVEDLAQFMDELKIGKAVLVGHSLGGIFLQDFATLHPEKTEALVLANAQARHLPPIGMKPVFQKRIDAFGTAEQNRAVFTAATPAYFKKGNLTEADLKLLVEINMKSGTPALKQAFAHLLTAEAIAKERWAKITMPVLIVASTYDIVPFKVAVALNDALPNSRLAVIGRSGHTPMWERPERFAEVLNDFLAKLK
jgi:pimeloyl-ACP methyl ester carboxylesterase